MRLLIVADKLTGGAGNVAQQLASCFSQKEDNVVFLMIEANTKPKYDLSKVNIIDRKITPVKLNNPIKKITRYITSSNKLRNTINGCSADVIISFLNSISPEVLFSQWRTKTPIIVSERSNPYMEWEKRGWLDKLKWKVSYRRANKIVYQFANFEPFFKYAYKNNKTCVIPNMIFGDSGDNIIDEKGLDHPVRFAALASLFPVKRIDVMIDIFASLLKKHPQIKLNIYGDGPNRNDLEQQVTQLGIQDNVLFHGYILNTHENLCKNDVLLMTSEREGFPNAILDAMKASLPTVMFKCHEGLSEIIIDGVNGFLIEQDNKKAFVEKLDYLLDKPLVLNNMKKGAFSMKQKYRQDLIMGRWENCIKSVLS